MAKVFKKDSFYWSSAWRSFRKAYLQRHPVCAVTGCNEIATHVDHIIARSKGGVDFPPDSGLNGLCPSHHSAKTVGVDGGFGNQPKTSRYYFTVLGADQNGMPIDPNHPWNTKK